MNDDVASRTVAALLDSGTTLAHASNAAAVIAGIGCLLAHPIAARAAFAAAILCWFLQCWLAVRTRIDASLFRMLAEEPGARVRKMDELLLAWGLAKRTRERSVVERSIDERCRAALRLWRLQIAAFAFQCCALAIAILLAGTA
jgi:hypothetical protein